MQKASIELQYTEAQQQNHQSVNSPSYPAYQLTNLFAQVESWHHQSKHLHGGDTSSYSQLHWRLYYNGHPLIHAWNEVSCAVLVSTRHPHEEQPVLKLHKRHSLKTNHHTYHQHRRHHPPHAQHRQQSVRLRGQIAGLRFPLPLPCSLHQQNHLLVMDRSHFFDRT